MSDLCKDLHDDPEYLDYYGQQLYEAGEIIQAILILREALNIRSVSYDYVLLGNCYCELHNYELAEFNYQKAIWMVPNRFKSRYALYLLYTNTNQDYKRVKIGKEILNLPVKIPSPWIDYIKSAIRKTVQ